MWSLAARSSAFSCRRILGATVTEYNQYCADGDDPDWHVPAEFLKSLDAAPYYAFPTKATLTNTQGGAKRDTECRELDVFGEPIPHLYSAGEFGSFFSDIYNGGGNLGECVFTGRIAGANAAEVKSPEAILAAGSTEVDAITGATATSKAILAATADALSKVE